MPGDQVLTAIAPVPVGEGGVDEEVGAIAGVGLASPIATFSTDACVALMPNCFPRPTDSFVRFTVDSTAALNAAPPALQFSA